VRGKLSGVIPNGAVVVIDGPRPGHLAALVETTATALGLAIVTVIDGGAAVIALEELRSAGHEVVAFVFGPQAPAMLEDARAVKARAPHAHLVLVPDDDSGTRLRRELALTPRLGTGWTIARTSPEPIELALRNAVRTHRQRAHATPARRPRAPMTVEERAALAGRLAAERRRSARLEVTQALVDEPDLAIAGTRILRALGSGFGWSCALLWMVDPVANVMRCSEVWCDDQTTLDEYVAGSRQTVFPPGVGLPGIVWAQRAPVLVPDVTTDPHYVRAALAARAGLHTGYFYPILIAREVHGVIELIGPEDREPDAEVQDMIASAAGTIGQLAERRRIEQALRRHNDELVAADRRKNEFIAVLAHELRNPLAPIGTALKILQDAANPDEVARACGAIERQVGTLTRLVEDLLDVARITTGKIQLRTERVELGPVIGRVVDALRPGIDRHGLALTVAIPSEPLWLEADPVRIEQVLTNLLVNAAKYTDRGGRIWLTAAPVGPTVGQRRVVIAVRDTGIGITEDIRDHVFDMFAQAPVSRIRDRSGLGIGLTLVKRLVELHGGEIAVASPGAYKGSEFSVRLPLLPQSFTEEIRAAASASPVAVADDPTLPIDVPVVANPAPRRVLRVLIVDDNTDAADTLEIVLRRDGHDVRTCYDGTGAIATAGEFRPDVVLLDIGLPGMNGHEVATRLRADVRSGPSPLLVAVTGWGQEADRERSRAFDHYLVKPARLADIRGILTAAARPAQGDGG
jgi:signal transduction histidine kinase/ActR/RegA family two-component response regulator